MTNGSLDGFPSGLKNAVGTEYVDVSDDQRTLIADRFAACTGVHGMVLFT